MKNEKWRMKSEEWKVKNEKWRMKSEEWRMKDEEGRVKREEGRGKSMHCMTVVSLDPIFDDSKLPITKVCFECYKK